MAIRLVTTDWRKIIRMSSIQAATLSAVLPAATGIWFTVADTAHVILTTGEIVGVAALAVVSYIGIIVARLWYQPSLHRRPKKAG